MWVCVDMWTAAPPWVKWRFRVVRKDDQGSSRFLFLLALSSVDPVRMCLHSQRLFVKAGEAESHWNEVKLCP